MTLSYYLTIYTVRMIGDDAPASGGRGVARGGPKLGRRTMTRRLVPSIGWGTALAAVTMLSPLLLVRVTSSLAEQPHASVPVMNSIGMKLVLIPAGEFMMGAEEEMAATLNAFPYCNPEVLPRERPRHRVRITKPFYMGAFEVTLAQFRTFCRDARYWIDAEDGQPMTGYGPKGEIIKSTAFRPWAPGWPIGPDHPAGYVSWND